MDRRIATLKKMEGWSGDIDGFVLFRCYVQSSMVSKSRHQQPVSFFLSPFCRYLSALWLELMLANQLGACTIQGMQGLVFEQPNPRLAIESQLYIIYIYK